VRSRQGADGSAPAHLRLTPPMDDFAPVLNLAVGDRVVYASHGIGRVEARRAGGAELPEVVVLGFESGLTVTLPLARARDALRSPSGEIELANVQRTLRVGPAPSIEPWSRRFRSTREKVTAGEVTGLAEVVREGLQRERQLAVRAGGRATPAPSERGLYLQARKLLAAEIALARGIDPVEADTWIVEQVDDYARR
jgi:RNA polymerase-interacting CarD/CdnL/TRCF family regulator